MKMKPLTLEEWVKSVRPLVTDQMVAQVLSETNDIMSDMATITWPKRRKSREQTMMQRITKIVGEKKAREVLRAMRRPTSEMLGAGDPQDGTEQMWRDMIKAALK